MSWGLRERRGETVVYAGQEDNVKTACLGFGMDGEVIIMEEENIMDGMERM